MPSVILGLGTNQGNRIENLRLAITKLNQTQGLRLIKKSAVFQSKALLKVNAPKDWDIDYFNCCIDIETDLLPRELLVILKEIEVEMGRDLKADVWSPRIIDIDILTWEDKVYQDDHLCIPHKALLERSFVLIPLLQINPLWLHPKFQSSNLHLLVKSFNPLPYANYRLNEPKLMGILNLSPDSFSGDGIVSDNLEDVKQKFIQLVNNGGEIIDIGAVSSKPNSSLITPEQEWEILKPVLDQIVHWLLLPELMVIPRISIDTYHYQIVEKLLHYPIDFINDISGAYGSQICQMIKNTKIKYISMHNCGLAGGEYLDLKTPAINQILSFFKAKKLELLSFGLSENQIVFDVGIGFGKHPFQAQNILDQLDQLKSLGVEILVGHSRKASVVPSVSSLIPEKRDFETALISYRIAKNVDYLRIHDVGLSHRALCC